MTTTRRRSGGRGWSLRVPAILLLLFAAAPAVGAEEEVDRYLFMSEPCMGFSTKDAPFQWLLDVRWAVGAGGASWWAPGQRRQSGLAVIPEVGWTLLGKEWRCQARPPPDGMSEVRISLPARMLTLGVGVDGLLLPRRERWGSVRPQLRVAFGHDDYGGPVPWWEVSLAAGPTFDSGGTGVSGTLAFALLALEVGVRYGFTPASSEQVLALTLSVRNVQKYIPRTHVWR